MRSRTPFAVLLIPFLAIQLPPNETYFLLTVSRRMKLKVCICVCHRHKHGVVAHLRICMYLFLGDILRPPPDDVCPTNMLAVQLTRLLSAFKHF